MRSKSGPISTVFHPSNSSKDASGNLCILIALVIIFTLGIVIQSYLLINPDVSWTMHIAERILSGGKYYYNFFENNPPFIFYFTTPAAFLARKIGIIDAARIYLFTLISISLISSWGCLAKLFIHQKNHKTIFVIALALILIIQPASFFGEREHVALILVLPYIFLAALRAESRAINTSMMIAISLMAACGFIVKPFFVIAFALIEFYLLSRLSWKRWCRADNFIICLFIFAYPVLAFIFTPDYIYKMIPYAFYLFSPYYSDTASWLHLLTTNTTLFLFGTLTLYYGLQRFKIIKPSILSNLLVISSVGFFLAYACQLLVVPYHEIPTLGFSSLLFCYIIVELWEKGNFFALSVIAWGLWLPLSTTFYWMLDGYVDRNDPVYNQLINYTREQADHRSVYFFTTNLALPYPLIDYAKVTAPSRFPAFWFLIGILLNPSKQGDPNKKLIPIIEREKFLIQSVTTEFQQLKPSLVYIYPTITWRFTKETRFDYIKFFSSNEKFKDIWKNYTYVKKIGDIEIYKRNRLT